MRHNLEEDNSHKNYLITKIVVNRIEKCQVGRKCKSNKIGWKIPKNIQLCVDKLDSLKKKFLLWKMQI